MKIIKWLLIVVVVLAVLIVGIGFLLPSHYRVERSATIDASPQQVYGYLADPRQWAKWTAWNRRDPAMKITYSGPHSGQGAQWAWESSEGDGSMTFTRVEPNKAIEYTLAFPDMGMASTGTLTLMPAGAATQVSWTAEGDVGRNPLMRWFVPFMDRMIGPDFVEGLANLKSLAEQE